MSRDDGDVGDPAQGAGLKVSNLVEHRESCSGNP
jgi:hypothetical protein